MTLNCPQCGMWEVHPSRRLGLRERLWGVLTIYPFRCQVCSHRFWAFLGRPSYNPSREFERLGVQLPVHFCPAFPGDQSDRAEGTIVDLSIRGCAIMSNMLVREGTCLRLQFKVTEAEPPIEVAGAMVRSAQGKKMTLAFYEIRKEEEDRLRRLIPILLCSRRGAV